MKSFYVPKSKYSAIKMVCRQGHKHDSRMEARYCNQLELLRKAGVIERYDVQISFPMEVNGQHICNHIPDFLVIPKDSKGKPKNHPEVHDTKGVRTAVFNLKYKLFKALYPQIEYKIITNGRKKKCSEIKKTDFQKKILKKK